MTDYEEQAKEFLSKTGTEFSAKFLKHDKYFEDDKESRDIYEIALKRGEREYKFKFGQSVNDSNFKIKNRKTGRITHQFTRTDMEDCLCKEDSKKVSQIKKGRINYALFNNKFFTLTSNDELIYPKEPTPYEVLAAMTKYMPADFEDFCSNYGYDTDSRKPEKIYNAVVDEVNNLMILYNDKEMEMLQEIS